MQRPFVVMNMAETVDGKITSAAREEARFTSAEDRLSMDRLRAEADAVIVGAGTVRADNPSLRVRSKEMQAYRARLGKAQHPIPVLVTRSGALAPTWRIFTEGDVPRRVVATLEGTAIDAARVAPDTEVWRCGESDVDPVALLQRLGAIGCERVLLEGGGELNWCFVAAGAVDEICVTIAPALLGGRDAPTLLEGRGFSLPERRLLTLLDVRRCGDELFCRYGVRPR